MTAPHQQVLRDPDRDALLRDVGFVTSPFLDDEEVRSLLEAHARLVPGPEQGVQLDFVRQDRALVRRLTAALEEVLAPRIHDVFTDHEPVLSSYVVKHPGPDSDFFLHRDVTVNDPRTTPCFTVWIPLVDVGPERGNGGLEIIPASHLLPAGATSFDTMALLDPYQDCLRPSLQPIDLAAGTALVYDTRTLHKSPPNTSDAPRPAIGCLISRRSVPLVHIVPTGRRHRRVHHIDKAFFLDHHPQDVMVHGMPPGYPEVDHFDEVVEVTDQDLERVLGIERPRSVPVVPADVARGATGLGWLTPVAPTAAVAATDGDLALGPDELAPLEATVGALAVTRADGACGRGATQADGSTVVALLTGSRVALEVPTRDPATGALATILDGPSGRSGMLVGSAVAATRPGARHALPPGAQVVLWNDGPGQLVVDLAPAPPPGGWFHRLIERFSPGRVR